MTEPVTCTYQWKRDGTNVGSGAEIYTLVAADVGAHMTCVVTATNAGGSASATSNSIGPIMDVAPPVVPPPVNTAPPVISGTAQVGQVLTVTSDGTWNGTPPPEPPIDNAPNIWMATPDIIAFSINDPPIIPGNIVSGSFGDKDYNKWFQMTNPRSGNLEWCAPIGPNRAEVRFSDLPNPAGYLNKVALRTRSNYSISGGGVNIDSVHYRDEANGQGQTMGAGTSLMITQRHTVLLKLSGVPMQHDPIIITNTAAGIEPLSYTFDDKTSRAGGIQINQVGHRPDDAWRYVYLAARVPGGANAGTVDFIKTYGFSNFQILDSNKNSVFSGNIVQRVSAAATTGEGFDSGIDIADLAQGWAITDISKAASAIVTCPGHRLAVGDKVRMMGVNGMTQMENPPNSRAGSFWFAPEVTAADASTVTLNVNSTAFTTFANTAVLSEALGGVNNKIYKCFNTNRAGTFVYGLNFSSWKPSANGTYYVHIPGYGISDPLHMVSDAWAQAAAQIHQGMFTQRLGVAVRSTSGYARGVALSDGVNGVTNYRSTLPAMFCNEGAQYINPVGSSGIIGAGLGGYANVGTLVLTGLTCTGTLVTATTAAPHGVAVGQSFGIQTQGCTPTYYNHGNGGIATSTGANTFTYESPTRGTLPTPATVVGYCRTGFVTNVRHPGHVGPQDAGDNDGPGVDHIPGWKGVAFVLRNVPKSSRVTPYKVPLSSAVLDPTLFAGTDEMPPLFHEVFYFSEVYRKNQQADGSVWGGHELGKFSSMIADYPETIDKYRGTDAGGALSGQTVHAYIFARDHYTTFLYAGLAAQLAQIAYDYNLSTLGDTYQASSQAAYAWADRLYTDPTINDAYYKGELDLAAKAGWSESTYQNAMTTLNGGYMGRVTGAKADAAGSLYRLLGKATGQTPYGDFIEKLICIVANIATPGTGYKVNDFITMAGGTFTVPVRILVTAVDANGGVTGRVIMTMGQFTTRPTNPVAQASTTGAGTGATFTLTFAGMYSQMVGSIGAYDYCMTSGADANAKGYMQPRSGNKNPDVGLNPSIGYQGMYFSTGASTSGGSQPAGVLPAIQAHMHVVAMNGINPTTAASPYIQLMQAGCSFIQGANLPGKAFVTGMGPRPFKCILHEDSFKLGTEAPSGINPFGYFSWGTSFMFFNFAGSVPTCDGPLIWNSDNVSGQFETTATPGSAKMWNPWRGGSSYWEWAPENRNIIYNSELTLASMLSLLAMLLYLHSWDGNA